MDWLVPVIEFIIAQIHYVELSINEAAHTANSDAPLLTATGIDGTGHVSDFERIECLWRSVSAIKSWLDIFLSLPPSEFRGFSFLFWAQMARCVVILYRLSTLEDPAVCNVEPSSSSYEVASIYWIFADLTSS